LLKDHLNRNRKIIDIGLLIVLVVGVNLGRLLPKYTIAGIAIFILFYIIYLLITLTSDYPNPVRSFRISELMPILLRLLIPITYVIFTIIYYKCIREPQKHKDIVKYVQNVKPSGCSSIRYGIFKDNFDTIERLKIDNKDIEIHNHWDSGLAVLHLNIINSP
jgi:hypothetical protein